MCSRCCSCFSTRSCAVSRTHRGGVECYHVGFRRRTISMDVQVYKDALLKKRSEILGAGGIKPLQASMENNTRQGDMADQASGNNEVHIQLKLKQTDAKILRNIEEALWRIEHGTYGVCRDCGEPIAEARLNAIPWSRLCITCKEKQGS